MIAELFEVQITFDGMPIAAEVTFVPGTQILLGTALLQDHRLEINFRARTVSVERVA